MKRRRKIADGKAVPIFQVTEANEENKSSEPERKAAFTRAIVSACRAMNLPDVFSFGFRFLSWILSSSGPTGGASDPVPHKFGNHFCTVSAPLFAVSDRGFLDYQRLTTKWEPRNDQ